MKDLLTEFSVGEILLFSFGIAFAVKEIIGLIKYFKDLINDGYDSKIIKKEQIQFFTDSLEELKLESAKTAEAIEEIKREFDNVNNKITTLTESDKDAIKGWIVSQYYHFMEQGWIDDFSMDTLEKRYDHYVEEGGNHYIHTLMSELRELPKDKDKLKK